MELITEGLKGALELGIIYRCNKDSFTEYVDTDWGSCPVGKRYYIGLAFILIYLLEIMETVHRCTLVDRGGVYGHRIREFG